MTTIAYKDGILAADTRGYSGSPTPIGSKHKIFRLQDGSIAGVSTTEPGIGEMFLKWLSEGAYSEHPDIPPDKMKFQSILVKPDGAVFYFSDSVHPSGPFFNEFFAIGSGDQYAIGALSRGASAEEAVGVAAEHDPWTDGPIDILELNPTEEAA